MIHLDLFAGAGGWSTAASRLGTRLVGLELDPAACDTRTAAGHATISTDITAFPTGPLASGVLGMTASPPCQSWSAAGKRLGLIETSRSSTAPSPTWPPATTPAANSAPGAPTPARSSPPNRCGSSPP